jgi:hypothetical protein
MRRQRKKQKVETPVTVDIAQVEDRLEEKSEDVSMKEEEIDAQLE